MSGNGHATLSLRPPRTSDACAGGAQPKAATPIGEAPLADLVEALLHRLGEDPAREGLQRTPERVARSLEFLTSGYGQDVDEILNGAVFEECYSEMVLVRDIQLFSLCEHHLLPFHGRAHIAYVPVTSSMRGVFLTDQRTRAEFLALIHSGRGAVTSR